ncbi:MULTISPECIES: hypothetical protein [Deefgea]|uniref:Integrase n=1 Tax=Deefgea chitinilytica TaxID=570276 RepID=A0ABS2C9M5_9NEIS|nr:MULTISPECIES: hypothetical protein [Deefgea]MBM5570742.1 hypothetical protein [Deefgea chitinilytica]MBM9887971.1 hypothetical protein [Deefgea sp. CFH1-16]
MAEEYVSSDLLDEFINNERIYFSGLRLGINWSDVEWNTKDWLPHRGKHQPLIFKPHTSISKIYNPQKALPEILPQPFQDFCKAMLVYLQRTRTLKFAMVHAYSIALRRLYNLLYLREQSSPLSLKCNDFESILRQMQDDGYKNISDAATHFKVIADSIDRKQLLPVSIGFEHSYKAVSTRHGYSTIHDSDAMEKFRRQDEKLPSREALEAYALCTNSPISDGEEILLRVIDLLIATGQRGNEISVLPLDCWVERPIKNSEGDIILDANGNVVIECGIRYYAEKQFQSRIHWFASQDIPFARRAVERLIVLTKDARAIAKWQESNPGRLWPINPEKKITESEVLNWLGFAKGKDQKRNLFIFLNRKGVARHKDEFNYYNAGEIEKALIGKVSDHVALKEGIGLRAKIILRTSEILAIAFDGQFRFGLRDGNVHRVFPRRVTIADINRALGSEAIYPSIFDRRNKTENDGSPIRMTSHQPRHWRNTIYHLAGLSDVQQALAMGRKKLEQNSTYQHTTIKEDTQQHHNYLSFNSHYERINFFHEKIRSNKIQGDLVSSYNSLKKTHGAAKAEDFLKIHATAFHLTPFGGCTHDFSQAPCPKHLQCWNGCSHLHLTGSQVERSRIESQIMQLEKSIEQLRTEGAGEGGSNKWIEDQERKLDNMKRALERVNISSAVIQVFPMGTPKFVPENKRKRSSVSDE